MNACATSSPMFTAAQIADGLQITKQAVQKALDGFPPSGLVRVGNQSAHGWTLDALPGRVRTDLEQIAEKRGYRGAINMLVKPTARWEPPIPFKDVSDECQARAYKLQKALAGSLKRKDDLDLSSAEFVRLGVEDFRREFGYEVSERQWQRVFKRTLDRDNAAGDWFRVDIYLDERPARRVASGLIDSSARDLHKPLLELVENLENKADPTPDDRADLFHYAFQHYEQLLEQFKEPRQQRAIKKSLVQFLFGAVPALSKSNVPESHCRVFEQQLQRWQSNKRTRNSLLDQRRLHCTRRPTFSSDVEKIVAESVLHGGNISLAHRKLRQANELSPEFEARYKFNDRVNKSGVARAIRAEVTPLVKALGPIHRGPWEAKMRGPYIKRDWSGVKPGDWYSGDDVTWNNYFYFREDSGEVQVHRGECLVITDLRTGYPLDFVLIAGKYNARYIRSLLTMIHDQHGLPHQGFYFEKGVWASRWIDGKDQRGKDDRYASRWIETENGLREHGLGLQVRHAHTPRAKPIEGIFRILQERQRSAPGFVGFDERREKHERMQDFIARVRVGKEDPRNGLLSMEEWVNKISQDLEEFARDPQNGEMLPGVSPEEAWIEGLKTRPMRKLADNERYILATHKQPVIVRNNGITLKIGKHRLVYCNEETGRRMNQRVLAFYNIDNPDLLTCSDMDRQNYFSVRSVKAAAMNATPEEMATAQAAVNGHMKQVKALYGSLQHKIIATITRDDRTSSEVQELGEFHNRELERFKQERAAKSQQRRQLARAAETAGIPVDVQNVRNPDAAREALEDGQQAWARIRAKQESGNKTYVLKSSPVATPTTYWRLWNQVEKLKPGLSRHALTHKHLGSHPKVEHMNADQLSKMISVFSAIIRDIETSVADSEVKQ